MPLNILLADDSVPAQNMGKKILIDAGYHVQAVSNGLEALRRIADFIPDIVILDIFMPGYTGLELCERLRASDDTAALPVILTVGRLEPYRPEDGEHVHANAVIVKPFAAAELIAAVRSLIGAPPLEAANGRPALANEGPEDDLSGDPLQDASVAEMTDTVDLSVPTGEQAGGRSHEDVLDDVPFSFGESVPSQDATPWAHLEASPDGAELLLSDLDRTGPKSLVFNPDAGATPFSASVIDLLPSASPIASGDDGSAFNEFELEPEASHDPFEPELGISAAKEYSFSAAAGAGPTGLIASTAPVAYESPVFTPETAIEPGDYLTPVELESPSLEVLPLDHWLDGPEIAPPVVSSPSQDELGEAAEAITSEVAPLHTAAAEVVSTSDAVQPIEDEDARRLAFEALFNSTEPFPVEEFYAASPTGVGGATLPNLAELSEHHTGEVTPDTEIESLLDRDDGFVEPELDPYLMQEEEPRSADSRIPDRDPLLDDSFDTDWSTPASSQPAPAATPDLGESYAPDYENSPPPDNSSELIAPMPALPLEVELAEGQVGAVESLPPAPETLDKWAPSALAYMAGIVEAACEAVPTQPKSASEVEYPEAQQVAPEPIRSESELPQPEPALPETVAAMVMPEAQQAPPEPMHTEPDVPGSEPPPVQEPEAEPAPVKEPEPQPAPVPPELMSSELATFQSNPQVAEISSSSELPPQLTENERIHQAVDRVFDRFKRLLVTAIVRELARHD